MRSRERSRRPRLSYANVVSTIALVLAMSGSAYAVTQLPRESVGVRQLKKGAVTPAKLSPRTLQMLKRGALGRSGIGPAGPVGPRGDEGPRGPRGEPGPEPIYPGPIYRAPPRP